MGKRIISQKRGKGSLKYRVPNYHFKPVIEYRDHTAKVVDIVNQRIRNPPLAKLLYDDGKVGYIVAPYGIRVGDGVQDIVVPLGSVGLGKQIFSIETYPNSGPKLCRTSGSSAVVVPKTEKACTIRLPSKKTKTLNPTCRVTIGTPAGSGRKEKPWVKAGKKSIAMHARGKYYPRTSGGKMNALDHPYGGPSSGPGKPRTTSRHAPPGRKVGSIAARRTGRKKK